MVIWLFALLSGIVLFLIFIEQIMLLRRRKDLPGPTWTLPFLGGIVKMVLNPHQFWSNQAKYGPLSWNYIVGMFTVFSRDTETSRRIFENNSKDSLKIILHPNAEIILGANNIAFMQGPEHKELRKQLLPLFTIRALSCYVTLQDKVIRKFVAKWLKNTEEVEMRPLVRDLNLYTSLSVFVGPYLDKEQRKAFAQEYFAVNSGFLCFPINLPGTTLNKAVKGRKKVVERLERYTKKSKERMAKGEEPLCLLDFWMVETVKNVEEAENQGLPPPPHSDDYEIACTVLDFIFASQDASTSSLVWAMALLDERPDVLARIREEQFRFRPNDEPVTHDLLRGMQYTHQVMKEILRYRPPATLVPHVALEEFKLTEDLTVPKGTMVIPSVFDSSFNGWTDPHSFDPDRWGPERAEYRQHGKHWLVFGHGPHYCLGQQYAMNHIKTFLSILGTNLDMTRRLTPNSNNILYLPTIYPGDCLVTLKPLDKEAIKAKLPSEFASKQTEVQSNVIDDDDADQRKQKELLLQG